jgi:hypothetical protein
LRSPCFDPRASSKVVGRTTPVGTARVVEVEGQFHCQFARYCSLLYSLYVQSKLALPGRHLDLGHCSLLQTHDSTNFKSKPVCPAHYCAKWVILALRAKHEALGRMRQLAGSRVGLDMAHSEAQYIWQAISCLSSLFSFRNRRQSLFQIRSSLIQPDTASSPLNTSFLKSAAKDGYSKRH